MDQSISIARTNLDVKELNKQLILQSLYMKKTATVKELAQLTGLSSVTIGTLLQVLVQEESVHRGNLKPSQGGRPSVSYSFNESKALGLAAFTREIEGLDTLCLRICDLYGKVIESQDLRLQDLSLEAFDAALDPIIDQHPQIKALGFGLPGLEYSGTLVVHDYPALLGKPFVKHFEERYKIPVFFENDVNAAVLGLESSASSQSAEVYIYFPQKYPPGAGIRLNGHVLKGKHNFAGEVSYLPLGVKGLELAENFELCCNYISQILSSISSVLDPDMFVLFAEFLGPKHLEEIRSRFTKLLPAHITPEIRLSKDFSKDFEKGLFVRILDLINVNKEV